MDNITNKNGKDESWRGKGYSFFTHKNCEAFPCHSGIDENAFNCLFCYCPLYMLGSNCGGNFIYLKNGVKDCGACTLPHDRDNYGYVTEMFDDIVKAMALFKRRSGAD